MDQFLESCKRSDEYPKNLINTDKPLYNLRTIETQVDQRANRLFVEEGSSNLDVLEEISTGSRSPLTKAISTQVHTLTQLRDHLHSLNLVPLCRFACIHARHSRDKLRISRRMFNYLLTYYQIPPAFLEYIFPFGRQHFVQDFHSCGFRNTSRLGSEDIGLAVPQRNVPCRKLEMFYSLKSVEWSPDDEKRPWYVRQLSVYHSFDIEHEIATWITVKGNTLGKELAQSYLDRKVKHQPNASEPWPALSDTLDVHQMFCQWSAGDWQWYLNFLERSLQDTTRRALSTPVERQIPIPEPLLASNALGSKDEDPTKGDAILIRPLKRLLSLLQGRERNGSELNTVSERSTEKQSEKDAAMIVIERPSFSFNELQHVQFVEEKAAETSLVLKANAAVLHQIRQTYASLFDGKELEDVVRKGWERSIERFLKQIDVLISDLEMQQSRANMLLRLAGDRKSLLYGILQYQSMKASHELAEKAQSTAANMEAMTVDMHEIARKTKAETVSMRIITLVTLFFLPGTFISTLMSTPIVEFKPGSSKFSKQNIGFGALQLYVIVSLPLVLLTFMAWWGVYWWERRRERRRQANSQNQANPVV